MKQFSVQMIDNSISSHWWKEIMEHFIRVDDKYEIRCWKEEAAEIEQASLYGTAVDDKNEVSIKGTVTKDLLEKLLIEEPTDKSIYNKMTKYFTIHVRNDLCDIWSEHYGTEMVINITSDADIEFFEQVMRQYPESFSINLMKSEKQIKRFKFILWIAFIMYLFAAYRLIIWKGWGGFSYISQCYASFDNWKQEILLNLNLVPFRFLFDIHGYTLFTWCKNVIGNIILFVPVGFFLLCLFPDVRVWSFKKYTFIMAAIIIGIELFQLFFMCGHCDIDDFMLNLLGACLSFQVTKQVLKMKGISNE